VAPIEGQPFSRKGQEMPQIVGSPGGALMGRLTQRLDEIPPLSMIATNVRQRPLAPRKTQMLELRQEHGFFFLLVTQHQNLDEVVEEWTELVAVDCFGLVSNSLDQGRKGLDRVQTVLNVMVLLDEMLDSG
jgi:hypothetical protein